MNTYIVVFTLSKSVEKCGHIDGTKKYTCTHTYTHTHIHTYTHTHRHRRYKKISSFNDLIGFTPVKFKRITDFNSE